MVSKSLGGVGRLTLFLLLASTSQQRADCAGRQRGVRKWETRQCLSCTFSSFCSSEVQLGWRESKGWKNRGRTKEGVGVGQTALAMCSLRSSNNVNRMKVMKNTEVRQGPRWTWLLLCRCWRCAFLLDTGNVGLDLEAWTGVSDTGRVTRANLWTYAWGEDIISSDTEV